MSIFVGTFQPMPEGGGTGSYAVYCFVPKSGYNYGSYANVKKDDELQNTSTGQVYKAKRDGRLQVNKNSWDPIRDANWAYARTDVAKKPTAKPTGLAKPTRDGTAYTAKWASQKASATDCARFESMRLAWQVARAAGSSLQTAYTYPDMSATSATFNLNSFKTGGTAYTRASFYPIGSTRLTGVTAVLNGRNSKGEGPAASSTFSFKAPRKPTIAWSFNASNGEVTATIKTNAGADAYERYDTRFVVTVRAADGTVTTPHDGSSTSTSFTKTVDLASYQGMSYSQYIEVKCEAWARGVAGNSEHVISSTYIAYPPQPTIKSTTVSGKGQNDKATLAIKTNSSTQHPVTQVKLEYLADVEYASASQIPGSAEWRDSGIVDDAQCTALAMGVGDLLPSPGNHSYLRVKSWARSEVVLYRYSVPVRLTALETPAPTAADERIKVLGATPQKDGTTMAVLLGWNASGTDDADGTELTWSSDANAWKSTEGPEKFEFDWSDGKKTVDGTAYNASATIYVKGLEQGEKYVFKARRYMEMDGGGRTYSPYSNALAQVTTQEPDSVTASADRYVAAGKALLVSWDFQSGALQKKWQIVRANGTVVASGSGTRTAYEVPASRLAAMATSNAFDYTVQVSTGSGWVVSESHAVTIVQVPTLSLDAPATLTAQPLSVNATCSRALPIKLAVVANGSDGETPTGPGRQPEGDVVYSAVVTPAYSNGSATIELPGGLDLRDGASYTVRARAVYAAYGIESEEAEASFTVDWAHKAVLPEAELEAVDEVTDEGHVQAVVMSLAAPSGSASDDRYDVYRLTGGGAVLVAEGAELDATVTDRFAPFGTALPLYYRIALRTSDGDTAWSDFLYYQDGGSVRFDWEGGSVELPYNIELQDGYSKGVEVRTHMDGTQDAYWDGSAARKAAMSTDVIRVEQAADLEAVRRLARYAGPVFVRTPDGQAFAANVNVTDLSGNSQLAAVAFDAEEIELLEGFMAEVS